MKLYTVILAAGEGKRMRSKLPKVLHTIGGLPMLERVINTTEGLKPKQIFVVHGNGSGKVQESLAHLDIAWVEQKEQLGTAHAVHQVIDHIPDDGNVLILYGDVPLISNELLVKLIDEVDTHSLGLVTAELETPDGFGRIIRDENSNVIDIIEHKDLAENELDIEEINTGIMLIPAKILKEFLPKIENKNSQGEYYLTDIIALAVADHININSVITSTPEEVLGVNDKYQLACLERFYQYQKAKEFTEQGLTLFDPERFDLRGELEFGQDVVIDLNVIIEGKVTLGNNVKVGANTVLRNITIGDDTIVLENCVLEEATVENSCRIGPFTRIRPGTQIESNAHVGNFVELKKTKLGENSKASHLTYLGDSTIGKDVNIGAGTITCNYDGQNKFETIIGDNAFIGSNSALVAPITISKGATIGAGSTITSNAPAGKLTVTRTRQKTIDCWQRPKKICKS